jgi:hypothetical protein
MLKDRSISVIVDANADAASRQAFPSLMTDIVKSMSLSQKDLSENLRDFVSTISGILEASSNDDAKYVADEIELNLVVNASGGIELVGKISSGIQTSIRLVLRRRK